MAASFDRDGVGCDVIDDGDVDGDGDGDVDVDVDGGGGDDDDQWLLWWRCVTQSAEIACPLLILLGGEGVMTVSNSAFFISQVLKYIKYRIMHYSCYSELGLLDCKYRLLHC